MSNYTCFRKAVTIKRKQGGGYVDGKWVEGSDTDVVIKASIQPLTPEEMQELPEGRRSDEAFKMYTKTKLFTITDQNPEYVWINGFRFEVISVGKYQSKVISHYKVIVAKKADER